MIFADNNAKRIAYLKTAERLVIAEITMFQSTAQESGEIKIDYFLLDSEKLLVTANSKPSKHPQTLEWNRLD